MGKSKIPIKRKGGFWARKNKSGPLKTTVVNLKKERAHRILWILKWVVGIPAGIYVLWLIYVVIADIFFYSAH